ncbi:hypothetical protein VE03_05031 [Pseudogymnoascus sp. 23342-1-I1]|nr:hypothetical protein VE03_05031 [Pseudogymnoascus sp. 23342-1-I1]
MSDGNWVHNGSPQFDHDSKYKQIMAVSITLTCVMTIVVCLRGYVRGAMLKALGWDDFVIFFAALCTITYTGLCVGQTRWGLGLTVASRPKLNFNSFSVLNFAGKSIYMGGILGFKVALCLSYLRILTHSNRRYEQIIWLVLITCTAGHFGGILLLIFLCKPIQKSWKPLTPGYCIPNANSVYGLGAVSIFYDIVILLLPIPLIIKLHINKRKKIGLAGIFTLGIFTTFCSIMRLVQVKAILATGDQTGLVMWATVEMTVGVTLTCLPTLLPLIKYYQDKKASSGQGSYPLQSRSNLTYSRGGNVKTGPTSHASPEWNDRDSIDNSSQKKILGLQSSVEACSSEESSQHQRDKNISGGIIATTEVQIHHSSVASEDLEKERIKNRGGDW